MTEEVLATAHSIEELYGDFFTYVVGNYVEFEGISYDKEIKQLRIRMPCDIPSGPATRFLWFGSQEYMIRDNACLVVHHVEWCEIERHHPDDGADFGNVDYDPETGVITLFKEGPMRVRVKVGAFKIELVKTNNENQ